MKLAWQRIMPELPARDVVETQTYYQQTLDCRIAWVADDGQQGAVYQGQTELLFYRSALLTPPHHCYIRVLDADLLFDRYRANGASVAEALYSKPWGMREFSIEDINGHLLTFGHAIPRLKEFGTFSLPPK